ncbi:sulfur carrier protein ThiS [Alkalispirillum mobile]|uniref:Sulfur carrier protein ThiS n=2 Tax=Alkalispirillum mobile TaxID=85925 RepID=A0A498BSL6_9GAMM|nr:sulfur carrier protein ThiS [Alkalispirillum mobile]
MTDHTETMQIRVNGEAREVRTGITAAELLEELDLAGRRLALEVNEAIVPRSRFEQHRLQPGDRVEVVQAIGGG